jgi:hypothetical protein
MAQPQKKQKRVTRSLAELVPGAMSEALAAQGFAGGEILLRWPDIAGPELAGRSEPIKLAWPRGKGEAREREPAVLHVQVESAFALELQMQSAVIMERINRYFGWRCVGAIKLKQGPVGRAKPAPTGPEVQISSEEEARIAGLTSGLDDGRLAEALQRLGRAIAASRRR